MLRLIRFYGADRIFFFRYNKWMNANKLDNIPLFEKLPEDRRRWIFSLSETWPFSFQQLQMLTGFAVDMICWDAGSPERFYSPGRIGEVKGKQAAGKVFQQIREGYDLLKNSLKAYPENDGSFEGERKFPEGRTDSVPLKGNIMGRCPVASPKTRCCNLQTLDAVRQCGFDCSYCSIQSFYHGGRVCFVDNLSEHLESLKFDRDKFYHIGTGQSSDSLMWGNRNGLLDDLCRFAAKHPNIILEMKSKSGRVGYFLKNRPPFNMVFTWSLNPPVVARFEEKGAAGLEKRLESARKMADLGSPVGFHFHPIVWYDGWQKDYCNIVDSLAKMFRPEEVVMVSLGTLTFIKPVIKRIRERMLKSSILQMPFEEIAGKYSYPFEIKKELFQTVYSFFPESWKNEIFFYMCMEDIELWGSVFGRSYDSNEAFETDMLATYNNRIKALRDS